MVGKDCVAIACDLRLGLQALTVSNNFPKIFNYAPSVFLGLTGLATDVQTVSDTFRYKVNMYRLREERNIAPQTLANLVSSSLYERRFGPWFVSPVLAGINHTTGKPFICGFDSIGCIDFAKDFIVAGTASDQLFGTCEGLWEPDLVGLDPLRLTHRRMLSPCLPLIPWSPLGKMTLFLFWSYLPCADAWTDYTLLDFANFPRSSCTLTRHFSPGTGRAL